MKWLLVSSIVLGSIIFGCSKPNELPNIIVYGHAGTSLHKDRTVYPANSKESILYAFDILDADGIEIDIQMTKDSVLVLFHDAFLYYTTSLSGCVSSYNYSELKDLNLDHSKYKIVTLQTILELAEDRQKNVFIDVKSVDFCTETQINAQAFQIAFDKAIAQIDPPFLNKITIGSRKASFLLAINFPNKCFETIGVTSSIETATDLQFNSVLFFSEDINKNDIQLLNNSNLNWGLIGLKDKWSIDNALEYKPDFVITDNIAYTNKRTK